jgi:hypothetical protein
MLQSLPSSPGHPYVFNEGTGLLSSTGVHAGAAVLWASHLREQHMALQHMPVLYSNCSGGAGRGLGEAGARERKQYIEDNRTGAASAHMQ